jgi:hypothetical protein
MRYLLLLYGDESGWEGPPTEEAMAEMEAWEAYSAALREAGAFVSGEGLEVSSAATTVRAAGDDFVLSDGPFAETREQLGGFYLLECRDLDEALAWAKRIPSLPGGGAVEVRPVMDYEAYGYENAGEQSEATGR